jgi:hypothetical protein
MRSAPLSTLFLHDCQIAALSITVRSTLGILYFTLVSSAFFESSILLLLHKQLPNDETHCQDHSAVHRPSTLPPTLKVDTTRILRRRHRFFRLSPIAERFSHQTTAVATQLSSVPWCCPGTSFDKPTFAQPDTMFSCSNQPRGCRGRCDTPGAKCSECRVRSTPLAVLPSF